MPNLIIRFDTSPAFEPGLIYTVIRFLAKFEILDPACNCSVAKLCILILIRFVRDVNVVDSLNSTSPKAMFLYSTCF